MRIVFFGTPSFAIPSLTGLIQSQHKVISVVTQPDKRKGRHRLLTPSPVKELALSKGIQILQPEKIRDPLFLEELSGINPDLIVVVAYGKILPAQILKLPPYGCINVHASLLPKYRGAAPIQWSLILGEKKTGVTTMLMDEGLDTGDILMQQETDITDDETAETMGERLSKLGASLLLETIKQIHAGTIHPVPQTGTPTFAPPLKKEDGRIDWTKGAGEIRNFVRGMYPWPGAYCTLNSERIKIIRVNTLEGDGSVGRVERTSDELVVGTGEGFISIIYLQPEGKRIMKAGDFIQGRRLKAGDFFDAS
jgi:methionyl-tRNA formyltransferase